MITKYLDKMKGQAIIITNGDSTLYQGKAELTPYWLTETVVKHISVVCDAIRLDVMFLRGEREDG